MRIFQARQKLSFFLLTIIFLLFSSVFQAQTDTTQVDQTEPAKKEKKAKKDKKKKDEFKVYAGIDFNTLLVDSDNYNSTVAPGWMLGFSYKRGKFFYWEVGVRYNNPVYDLTDNSTSSDSSNYLDGLFGVRNIDVPIIVGINFLSFASRIVGLRLFIGATPQFALGVGSNDLGITKDNINTFNVLGQAGIGVDVAFIYLESGVNYGFVDLFKNDIESKPFQIFLNLGFRF